MNENDGYSVFFFPQALEALGEAIKPYLQEGEAGPHVRCLEIDTGGSLIELTLDGRTPEGAAVEVELLVPSGMVRMIVSAHIDAMFGFGRGRREPHELPVIGPTAERADAPSTSLPATADEVQEPTPQDVVSAGTVVAKSPE